MRSLIKFRPSSHSTDVTLIATYQEDSDAEAAKVKVLQFLKEMKRNPDKFSFDWNVEDVHVGKSGNQVRFSVYTESDMDRITNTLEEGGRLVGEVEEYSNFQELTIAAVVPSKISARTAAVVLNLDEARAIDWLDRTAERKVTENSDGTQTVVWHYRGESIYSEDDGHLFAGTILDIFKHTNWTVREE